MKQKRTVFAVVAAVIIYSATSPVSLGQVKSRLGPLQQAVDMAPSYESAWLLGLLDSAYAFRSAAAKRAFFDQWFNESKGLENGSRAQEAPMADIHAIFVDFYEPDTTTLKRLTDAVLEDTSDNFGESDEGLIDFIEVTTGSPSEAEYVVVPGHMRYRIRSTSDTMGLCELPTYGYDGWGPMDSVDFYPELQIPGKSVLYLSGKYRKVLEEFLSVSPPDPYIASHSGSFLGVRDRVEFLRSEISISGLHWGGWQYHSYPVVYSIEFSLDMTEAVVSFRDSWCTGGDACYTKAEGQWTRGEDVGGWIE